MELPKVNIAVIGVVCSSLGGMVWYASEQASIIANLEETVAVLDAQSNTTDKVNMLRDIEQNTDNIEEMLDILVEMQEEYEDADSELWDEVDNMINYFTQLVQLQSRVAILENTVEFTRRDGM